MAGMLGLVVSTLGFAFADTYSVLVTARVAQGVAGGASWAIGLSMIADVFPSERLGVVMGTVMSAHCVGFTIGPVIGGFLYDYYGFQAPFLFCAAVATLDILAIFCIEEPLVVADQLKKQQMEHKQRTKKLSEEEHANPFATSVNGPNEPEVVMKKKVALFSLMKHRRVLTCVLVTIVSSSVFSGIEPSLPIYLQNTYHCSPATIGCKLACYVEERRKGY
jgi:MFS family permease